MGKRGSRLTFGFRGGEVLPYLLCSPPVVHDLVHDGGEGGSHGTRMAQRLHRFTVKRHGATKVSLLIVLCGHSRVLQAILVPLFSVRRRIHVHDDAAQLDMYVEGAVFQYFMHQNFE